MEIIYFTAVPILAITTLAVLLKTGKQWATALMCGISFILLSIIHSFYRPDDMINSASFIVGVAEIIWAYALHKRKL